MTERAHQGEAGRRRPQPGDTVSFGTNECVIEVARLGPVQPEVAGVHAVVDQYGEGHLVEDLEPNAAEPAWEIVLPDMVERYARA